MKNKLKDDSPIGALQRIWREAELGLNLLHRALQDDIEYHRQCVWRAQYQARKDARVHIEWHYCLLPNIQEAKKDGRVRSFSLYWRKRRAPANNAPEGQKSRSEHIPGVARGKRPNLKVLSKLAAEWEFEFVQSLELDYRNRYLPRYQTLVNVRREVEKLLSDNGLLPTDFPDDGDGSKEQLSSTYQFKKLKGLENWHE